MSDSNSIAVLERTFLNVYEADIFNCSRHYRIINPIAVIVSQFYFRPATGTA